MKIASSLILTLLIVVSCSSSKTTPSQWISDDFKVENIERLLIYANTDDISLQAEFEETLAQALEKEGIATLKMNTAFPHIKYDENHTNEEINQFVLECKAKNIDKVLLASRTSLVIDTIRTKSLQNYMNSLQPISFRKSDGETLVYDTKEVTTHMLEAAVYDIERTNSKDEPVATVALKVINPKSIETLKSDFLKTIMNLFVIK